MSGAPSPSANSPASAEAGGPGATTGRPGGPLLTVEGIAFGYGERRVLHDISLSVRPGEAVCVLGENGAGKSTLLRICAGLLVPQSGRVSLGDESLATILRERGRAAIARRLAYLPQESAHVFPFSALEVVLMGRYARMHGTFESSADYELAESAMAATDTLALRKRPFNQLSGGERRRVLLAQALAQDTALVLLDEPTAGLDPAHAIQLGNAMAAVCGRGRALLWTTHDLNLALRASARALLLHDGTVASAGPTRTVLEEAGHLLGVTLHFGTLPSGVPFAVPT